MRPAYSTIEELHPLIMGGQFIVLVLSPHVADPTTVFRRQQSDDLGIIRFGCRIGRRDRTYQSLMEQPYAKLAVVPPNSPSVYWAESYAQFVQLSSDYLRAKLLFTQFPQLDGCRISGGLPCHSCNGECPISGLRSIVIAPLNHGYRSSHHLSHNCWNIMMLPTDRARHYSIFSISTHNVTIESSQHMSNPKRSWPHLVLSLISHSVYRAHHNMILLAAIADGENIE